MWEATPSATEVSLLVSAMACAIDLRFGRVQFTVDLLPADIIGSEVLDQSTGTFRVNRGPVFVNLLLDDEINRALLASVTTVPPPGRVATGFGGDRIHHQSWCIALHQRFPARPELGGLQWAKLLTNKSRLVYSLLIAACVSRFCRLFEAAGASREPQFVGPGRLAY